MADSITPKSELRVLNGAELDNVTGAAAPLLQSRLVDKMALEMRDEFVASFKKANRRLADNPLDNAP